MQNIVLLADRHSINYKGITYSYCNAFKALGYNVKVVAFNTDERIYRYTKHLNILNNAYLLNLQSTVIREIANINPDFVFVIKGYYLLPNTIKKIKSQGVMVACFNPDDPYSSIAGSSSQNVRDCLPYYDAYFIWSKKIMNQLVASGLDNVFYLPFAADMDLMKPPREQPANNNMLDVCFIGNSDKERMSFLENLGLEIQGIGFTNAVFGAGWKKLPGFNMYKQAYNNEFLNAIHRSKVNLNILRVQNKGSHNMRTFDIPACGGFMLHEHSGEIVEFFEEDKEFVSFKSIEECSDKIRFYLKNDTKREQIALAGYERTVKSNYTYLQNVNSMVSNLSCI